MLTATSRGYLLAMVIALMMAFVPSGTISAADSPIDKPASELTRADLQQFVDLTFREQTSVDQVRTFLDKLTDRQRSIVKTMIDAKLKERMAAEPAGAASQPAPTAGPTSEAAGLYWTENIEYVQLNGPVSPYSYAATTNWCDTDPDTDYVFFFSYNSDNPAALGWVTSSASFYAAHRAANNWQDWTKGFGWTGDGIVHLCFSYEVVHGTGGPNAALANLLSGWKL